VEAVAFVQLRARRTLEVVGEGVVISPLGALEAEDLE